MKTRQPKRSKAMKGQGYLVTLDPNRQFIYFVAHKEREKIPVDSEQKLTEGQQLSINKFKIHINLPEDGSKQLAQGCDIINPILRKNKVDTFRMICQGLTTSEIAGEQCKVITINCFGNPEKSVKDWQEICSEVLTALLQAKIQPGIFLPDADSKPIRLIKGSQNFMAYSYKVGQWPEVDFFDQVHLGYEGVDVQGPEYLNLSKNKI